MNIEYRVIALDNDGYEVAGGCIWDTLRQAKVNAKLLVAEKEAIAAGMTKVEIRDRLDDCVADYFVKG
jgi:hypothetical protein